MELLNSHSEWNSQKFKGISFRNDHLSQVEFNTCAFIKCVFSETIFQKCAFHDCTFHNCDLNLVNLKDCVFSNTRFVESQIIGVDWTETALPRSKFIKPVDFSGCVINHSTFVGLNLKKIGLTKCIAQDVDFTEVDLTQANCTLTDFSNSRFQHTNLTEADFTGATNYAIAASLNTLKKTKFSLPEAMSLLYSLDIILTE